MSRSANRQWLKNAALEALENASFDRGLSNDELQDRTVPTFGLAGDGTRQLDFGPRSFTVRLGEDLTPMLYDVEGKALKSLPRAAHTDDAAKAKVAKQEWQTLRESCGKLVADQASRLERLMASQRQLSQSEFQQFFIEHPLVGPLARRLLWGEYERGKLKAVFRVAADGTFASNEDDEHLLGPDRQVALAHLALKATEKKSWAQIVVDYELVPPFPQLDRSCVRATKEEKSGSKLTRFTGHLVPVCVLFQLRSRGWRAEGAMGIDSFDKEQPGRLLVRLSFSPSLDPKSTKKEHEPGEVRMQGSKDFAAISAIDFSELCFDLQLLTRT